MRNSPSGYFGFSTHSMRSLSYFALRYTPFSGGQAAKERFERNPLWKQLQGVKAGNVHDVPDEIWMTSVSVQGAELVLDDLAKTFGVDPARA